MHKIKLAILTPDYYPNFYAGIGVHVYSLVESLLKNHDIDITVFVVRCETLINNSPRIYEAPKGAKVYEFSGSEKPLNDSLNYFTYKWTKNNIIAIEYLSTILSEMDFDLIHCHDIFSIWAMDLLRRKLNIPVVSTIHARFAGENEIGDALRGFLCRTSDTCIAVSNNLANELKDRYKIEDVKVVYNGITKSKIFGPVKKENYITYCGRMAKTKGIDTLLKAFSLLIQNDKYKDLKLILIGDGDCRNDYEKLVQSLHINKNVIFQGRVSNSIARNIISKSLVHIVPSTYEAFATVIEEAMMEQTCVIVSKVGGAAELIENGVNGILFEPNNIKELEQQMRYVLDNKSIREQLEKQALKRAMKFEWSSIANQIFEIYHDVLHKY